MENKYIFKIYKGAERKLLLIKTVKSFTGGGLKEVKYIIDLTPDSIKGNYFSDQHDIDEHIRFLTEDSRLTFELIESNKDVIIVTFQTKEETPAHTETLFRLELDELGVDYELLGIREMRNNKIDDILS